MRVAAVERLAVLFRYGESRLALIVVSTLILDMTNSLCRVQGHENTIRKPRPALDESYCLAMSKNRADRPAFIGYRPDWSAV
jgi:hypothetical protein